MVWRHSGGVRQCCGITLRTLFTVVTDLLMLAGAAAVTISVWAFRKQQLFRLWQDTFSKWLIVQLFVVGCVTLAAAALGLIFVCTKSRALLIIHAMLVCVSKPLSLSLLVIDLLVSRDTIIVEHGVGTAFHETLSQQLFFILTRYLSAAILLLETVSLIVMPALIRSSSAPQPELPPEPINGLTSIHHISADKSSEV